MKITKAQLKKIVKEERAGRDAAEAECAELQQSFDHAYNMFQTGDYTEDQFDEISGNLKKQAEFLVTSGRVGGCPIMPSKELEMSKRPISSVGGTDVGFMTGPLEEGEIKMKITKEQLRQIIKEELEAARLDWRGGPMGGRGPEFGPIMPSPSPGVSMTALWGDLNVLLDNWTDRNHQYYKDLYNLMEDYSTGPDRATRLPMAAE